MEIWVDSTRSSAIEKAKNAGWKYGITTNPSILAAELPSNSSIQTVIKTLLQQQDGFVAVQIISTDTDQIIKEAINLSSINPERIKVKIPVSREGLHAIGPVVDAGISVMATAICRAYQYVLVASAGVDYAAPYVDRILANPQTGLNELKRIVEIAKYHGTAVLGGAVKNIEQFTLCAELGFNAVTLSETTIDELLSTNSTTAQWVQNFSSRWEDSGLKLAS